MAFGGRTKFNGNHRPGRNERGRRTEENTGSGDDWNNRNPYGEEGEDDPRPIKTPGRRPFPPVRKPEIPAHIQLEKGRTGAGAEPDIDDLFAGFRIIITQADTLNRAEEASDTTEEK